MTERFFNLWISENARIGLEEEPLTREEIMNFLGRHYRSSAISSLKATDLKIYSQNIIILQKPVNSFKTFVIRKGWSKLKNSSRKPES